MKGYRFYLEYETPKDKRARKDTGNVLAVNVADEMWFDAEDGWQRDAIGAVYHHQNSAVASTSVSLNLLAKHTRRISEAQARQIHPALFEYLDQ
jgi:hypothetical protein